MRRWEIGSAPLSASITTALRTLPFVHAIALFGSLAEGTADEWSDVDMLVACRDVEVAKWAAREALRAAMPVLFYRPFSTAQQPSGRYWFEGESPFHKLDISFDCPDDYEAILNGGGRLGHRIAAVEVYRAHHTAPPPPVTPRPIQICERELEIGNHIYRSLVSLKHMFRGDGEDIRGLDDLRRDAAELPADAMMAGGRIGALVHAVHEVIRGRERISLPI